MLRDHCSSCVRQSATVSGPRPCAMASIAKAPSQPAALSSSVVEKSSARSGPRPPICRIAAVRTA